MFSFTFKKKKKERRHLYVALIFTQISQNEIEELPHELRNCHPLFCLNFIKLVMICKTTQISAFVSVTFKVILQKSQMMDR